MPLRRVGLHRTGEFADSSSPHLCLS